MEVDRISLIGFNDKGAESAEQDQTARMCSLILLYTLRRIDASSRTEKEELCSAKCSVAYLNSNKLIIVVFSFVWS